MGYDPDSKLFMIHADDAGLSHSENRATIKALQRGIVNSYSIMVPCPWFYEMAEFARKHPEYDCGIHLTLTCEWSAYKFGPVLGQSNVPSLTDDQGYFYKKRNEVVNNAKKEELKKELCAQIDRALSFGLRPTHLDSHMYSLGASPELLKLYREIGHLYKLPVMLNSKLITEVSGIHSSEWDHFDEISIDHMYLGELSDFKQGKLRDYYSNTLSTLKTGLNLLLIHPAHDDEEMKAITIDHPNFGSEWRQIDLEFFTSEQCEKILKDQGVQMITWKEIKDFMYPG